MRFSVFMLFLLLGIGQNLPYDVYWYGLGAGDVTFLIVLTFLSCHPRMRPAFGRELRRLLLPIGLILAFVVWALCSLLFNAAYFGLVIHDLFEIARYCYLLLLMVATAVFVRAYGSRLSIGFCLGVVVSGVIAYANPRNNDVVGTVMVWNPNVIGNMMAVGIVFSSLVALFYQRFAVASVIGVLCLVVGAFTFSKGAWLMCFFASVAFVAAILGSRKRKAIRYGKTLLLIIGIGFSVIIYRNVDLIREIWEFKLATTRLNDSAAEGGTVAARWGFILATKMMLASNPLFGVGISNFEEANRALRTDLGDNYWESDNPHSAWLHILACMGIPAFLLYLGFFALVFRAFCNAIVLRGIYRSLYLFSVVVVFVVSGAVMLQLLTGYFFWIFAGVAFALKGVSVPENLAKSMAPVDGHLAFSAGRNNL